MRIVFMGTPDFSVPILNALYDKYQVVLVVTQPDKVVGRKQILSMPPIKEFAIKHNLEVYQPIRIKEDHQPILDANPDIIITAAYGQIIPEIILEMPPLKAINVHASLLPKYRGGAPIHKAIINGEKETGISIMYMSKKMDAGNIISQEHLDIQLEDNVETLTRKLSLLGRDLLLSTLPKIIEGTNDSIKQDPLEVTFAYNITRVEEKINWNKTMLEVYNQIRGLYPWPSSYTAINGTEIKVFQAKMIPNRLAGKVGEVIEIKKNLVVQVIDGAIELTDIQVSGKKRMLAKDYLNGQKLINLHDIFE